MVAKNRGSIPGTWYPYKSNIKLEAREYTVTGADGKPAKATAKQVKEASFVDTNGELLLFAKKAVAEYFGLKRAVLDNDPKTVQQQVIVGDKVEKRGIQRSKRRKRPKGKAFRIILHKPYAFKDPDSGKSANNIKSVTLNVHPRVSVYEFEQMIEQFANKNNIKGVVTPSGTMRVRYAS